MIERVLGTTNINVGEGATWKLIMSIPGSAGASALDMAAAFDVQVTLGNEASVGVVSDISY